MPDLLLEIGTEEIPARFIDKTLHNMEESMKGLLMESRIEYGEINVFGTPRRLVLIVNEMSESQKELVTEVVGPPKKVAFDEQGLPTRAATGFARTHGVDLKDLKIIDTGKGEYICVEKYERGERTLDILPVITEKFLSTILFPRSMRWNDSGVRFARPIRWILSLFGEKHFTVSFAGLASGSVTYGHHFMNNSPIKVRNAREYIEELEKGFVIVDHRKRKEKIKKDIEKLAEVKGGEITGDGELLEEITFLTEYPVALCGSFNSAYLSLPKELLVTVLKGHQRCFSIEDMNGVLLPYFIAVSNTRARNMNVVVNGYERVIRARLADAKFFFEIDSRTHLDDYAEKLNQVVFMGELGTMEDKRERLKALSNRIATFLGYSEIEPIVTRAASICKADLMTEMVGEFPELQGVMGREYARLQGESEEVATAIFEHYLPRFSGDRLPSTPAGEVLSLVDKIDNIVGCFGTGNIPTGSNDPYAVRRQALGIMNILIEGKYFVSLRDIFAMSVELYGERLRGDKRPKIIDSLCEFFKERFYSYMVSGGYRYDCVRAVLSSSFDDPYDSYLRIMALDDMRKGPEFKSLVISFKRVINIIPEGFEGTVTEDLFMAPEETELYKIYKKTTKEVHSFIKDHDYSKAFYSAGGLKPYVDIFFDKVLVMEKDQSLRRNRLALLRDLKELFFTLADFTQIVVEGDAV